ncbi:VOC family protein [Microbacterium oleivorans]|uniref:VOC family protein n=1 Tax=Microbacterium oleivorans TaxID=273677 RepID=A0A7D5IQC4_9MICO|nr:VOC family protein [Microbacterium oleivorans]QLD12139.1 VOC family protein [Microbacterium oleivorans]
MSIPTRLDHVVIAGPDLAELVAWFAARTGVTAAPGGAHPTGTANALVALTIDGRRGPQYLELIGPDPDRSDRALPATFDIASLEAPSVQAYAVHPDDIQATVHHAREHGYDPGDVGDLSRRTPAGELLEWRLTRGPGQRLDVPFLIDWGRTPHPGLADIPTIELVSFERVEPDPGTLRPVIDALGLGDGAAPIVAGPATGYRLVLRTESGETVEL